MQAWHWKNIPGRIKQLLLNNHFIIQYNPYLRQKFKCRINVEACVSIAAVKYVYKSIYKGHDRCSDSWGLASWRNTKLDQRKT